MQRGQLRWWDTYYGLELVVLVEPHLPTTPDCWVVARPRYPHQHLAVLSRHLHEDLAVARRHAALHALERM